MEMETSASELITIVAEAVIIAKAEVKAKYAPLVEACEELVKSGICLEESTTTIAESFGIDDALKAVTNE